MKEKLSEDAMTSEDVIDMCEEMAGIGMHHLIFSMSNDQEIEPIITIGEKIIPEQSRSKCSYEFAKHAIRKT